MDDAGAILAEPAGDQRRGGSAGLRAPGAAALRQRQLHGTVYGPAGARPGAPGRAARSAGELARADARASAAAEQPTIRARPGSPAPDRRAPSGSDSRT